MMASSLYHVLYHAPHNDDVIMGISTSLMVVCCSLVAYCSKESMSQFRWARSCRAAGSLRSRGTPTLSRRYSAEAMTGPEGNPVGKPVEKPDAVSHPSSTTQRGSPQAPPRTFPHKQTKLDLAGMMGIHVRCGHRYSPPCVTGDPRALEMVEHAAPSVDAPLAVCTASVEVCLASTPTRSACATCRSPGGRQ